MIWRYVKQPESASGQRSDRLLICLTILSSFHSWEKEIILLIMRYLLENNYNVDYNCTI